MTDYKLPEPSRTFLCAKCLGRTPTPQTLNQEFPECPCGYSMFAAFTTYPLSEVQAAYAAGLAAGSTVDMVLFCPKCNTQHIDAPDERTPDWKNPPHKSHLCHHCGHVWRPSDSPTNGVRATASGKDSDVTPEPKL